MPPLAGLGLEGFLLGLGQEDGEVIGEVTSGCGVDGADLLDELRQARVFHSSCREDCGVEGGVEGKIESA